MGKKSFWGSFLRVVAVVVLSLAAAFTLLGGIGTSCVAFFAEKFGPSMAKLIPVKPIFQVLVVISIAAAIFGIVSIVRLVKGKAGAYKAVLLFLLVGALTSGIQFYYSLTLRGKTAPNNMRFYMTLLALVIMLILRLPGIWKRINFERGGNDRSTPTAAGAAFLLTGLLIMTTPLWAMPTHIINGYNTAAELLWPLILVGAGCATAGAILLARLRPAQAKAAIPADEA